MKKTLAWAVYDWANSAFALTVMAGFFPIVLKGYWAMGLDVNQSSFWLGVANAAAALVVALASPVLGAWADRAAARRRLLLLFTALGVVATAALHFIAAGQWAWAVAVFALASVAHSAVKPFYNALLLEVAPCHRLARVSSLGYALGYVGGGLLFAFAAWMVTRPELFGLADRMQAIRVAFLLVAGWWAAFTLPIMLWVGEGPPAGTGRGGAWRELLRQLGHVRRVRALWLFLLAYGFYIGAVGTVSRMGVDYGLALGFGSGTLIAALLIAQVVAFPAALLFGALAARFRERLCILAGIGIFALACLVLYRVESAGEFYLLAALIGSVLGGVQALSRSFYARLIPREESAGLFGLYSTVTRLSVVPGPALMGMVSLASGDTRLSIVVVLALLVVGAVLLRRVGEPAGEPRRGLSAAS